MVTVTSAPCTVPAVCPSDKSVDCNAAVAITWYSKISLSTSSGTSSMLVCPITLNKASKAALVGANTVKVRVYSLGQEIWLALLPMKLDHYYLEQ